MTVSSTTALTHELKPLETPFLPTDDPWFLWLKHQILIYFEDWLKTIEGKEYMKRKTNKKCLYNHKFI